MPERREIGRIGTITYGSNQGGLPELKRFWDEVQTRKPSRLFRALDQGNIGIWPSCHTFFYDRDKATVISHIEHSPQNPEWVLRSYEGKKTWLEVAGSIQVVAPGNIYQLFGVYGERSTPDNLNTLDTRIAEYTKAVRELPNDGEAKLYVLMRPKSDGQKGLVVAHREEQFLVARFPQREETDRVLDHLKSYTPVNLGQEFPFLKDLGLNGFFGDYESS